MSVIHPPISSFSITDSDQIKQYKQPLRKAWTTYMIEVLLYWSVCIPLLVAYWYWQESLILYVLAIPFVYAYGTVHYAWYLLTDLQSDELVVEIRTFDRLVVNHVPHPNYFADNHTTAPKYKDAMKHWKYVTQEYVPYLAIFQEGGSLVLPQHAVVSFPRGTPVRVIRLGSQKRVLAIEPLEE